MAKQEKSVAKQEKSSRKKETKPASKKINKTLIGFIAFLVLVVGVLTTGYFLGWFKKKDGSSKAPNTGAPVGGTPVGQVEVCTIDGCYPDFDGVTVIPIDTDAQVQHYNSLLDTPSSVYAYSYSEPFYTSSFVKDNSLVYFISGDGYPQESAYPSNADLFRDYATRHPQFASNFFCQFARTGPVESSVSQLICQGSTTSSKITPADLLYEEGVEAGGKVNSVIPVASLAAGVSCAQMQTACDLVSNAV